MRSRPWILSALIGVAVTSVATRSRAQVCTLSWNDPVGGLFADPGRWSTSPAAPMECQGRAPRDGDSVAFRPGTYTVTIPGSYGLVVTEFDVGGLPADITFVVGGSLNTRVLAPYGRLTLTGAGEVAVSELVNLGGDASLVIDGLTVTLGPIFVSQPGPADRSRQFLVRRQGTLVTLAGSVPGTTVDAATWRHLGPPDGVGDITVSNGGRFEATSLNLRNSRLFADGGSSVDVSVLESRNDLLVRGESRIVNRLVTLGFGDSVVEGTGSKWTVTETMFIPAAAKVISSNRAELVVRRVEFSDPAGFAVLEARGTDSRVVVQEPLDLLAGNVAARDGGHVRVPAVRVGGGRTIAVGRGTLGLGGAQFDCAGELTLGSNGSGTFSVTGGGRASAESVVLGFSPIGGALIVDAAGGTAQFDVVDRIVLGQQGRGSLRVSQGGRLAFSRPGGMVIVTPEADGEGEVGVDGLDSVLDLGPGAIHVGRGGPGRMNVTGGGTLRSGGLLVGDTAGTGLRFVLVSGAQSAIHLRDGTAFVSGGTLRLANGGFVQIASDAVEGRLILESPATVDLVGGRFEIGNAGGAPVGILRVDRGLLQGSGTIRAASVEVIDRGQCRPGLLSGSDRALKIEGGSYLQDANGTLEVDVFGTAEAPQVLFLDVERSVTLNGKLVVNFLGITPKAGDRFGFVRFGEGLTGAFSGVELRGVASGVAFEQRELSPGLFGLVFTSDGTPEACGEAAPRIIDLDVSVPGRVTLSIAAGACGLYRLEQSPDTKVWRELTSFSGDASGVVTVGADRPTTVSAAYYRVVRW